MVNAVHLKELEIKHLYMEIKEKVMKRDNLQLLLLLLTVRGICTSATKDAEMGGKLQWIYQYRTLTLSSCISNKYRGVMFARFFLFCSL